MTCDEETEERASEGVCYHNFFYAWELLFLKIYIYHNFLIIYSLNNLIRVF